MGLAEYKKKRNFKVTAEPSGKPLPKLVKGACRFVIQKHDASRLHYDFRLEMDGVLKSWAVPKGLPWEKGQKHLAVEVEDHPVDYATFEGIIPQGQYGGGTVMVWDRGQYHVYGEKPMKALKDGRLHLVMDGEKATEKRKSSARDDGPALSKALAKLPKSKPRFIEPMKARLVDDPPSGGDWSYELKFDGFRVCAVKNGSQINLISRNGNELRTRFPEVVEALKEFPPEECVLDGEVVALDGEGRSSFQLLQGLEIEGHKAPIVFYVFDLMQLNGRSLIGLPLTARKEVLAKVCDGVGDPIRYSGEISGDARALLGEVQRRGLEGLIGKLRDSAYEPGRRSGTWIKLKCVNEQEFVIGGFTPPQGARQHFGAILVGYYDGKKFLFAGKVGTGFNTKSLAVLHKKLKSEKRDDCPFADLPSKEGGQWVQGITPSMMRKIHWVDRKST